MIAFLEGTIVEKQPTRVVLDVGGVGYEVFIPLSSYDRLPAKNETCRVLTYDHVREDAHLLFGFMTEAERRMFGMLLGTAGVGPKLALSALSSLSVRELKTAVVGGDVERLSSIPGVGRKTAERIVVDLRDKITAGEALEAAAGAEEPTARDIRQRDAVMALVALGYKQMVAGRMVSGVLQGGAEGEELTVEEIIKKALGA